MKYILELKSKNPIDNSTIECSTAQEANMYKHRAEKNGFKVTIRKEGKKC